MKKIVTLILVLLFMVPVASAENIVDFSTMSTDELVALRDSINEELSVRNFKTQEVIVPIGTYMIGVDIPAGEYIVRKTDTSSIPSVLPYTVDGKIVNMYFLVNENQVKLTLQEGQKIDIASGTVSFIPYTGLGF